MAPLNCHPSRPKIAGLLALTCVMVAACWFCTTLNEILPVVVGWIGIVFFGLGFFVLPRAWLNAGKPVIVVSKDGIDDRQSAYGFIPWEDITGMTEHSIKGTRMLSIHVRDIDTYLARVSSSRRVGAKANQSLGYSPITLGFTGLTPGIDEVLRYIEMLGHLSPAPENER